MRITRIPKTGNKGSSCNENTTVDNAIKVLLRDHSSVRSDVDLVALKRATIAEGKKLMGSHDMISGSQQERRLSYVGLFSKS